MYAMTFDRGVFTPDGKSEMTPAQAEQYNAELEAAELATWAKAPDRWQVYVTDWRANTVTSWRGVVLGTIIEARKFSTNISRNMVAIRFRGTNGAIYYGRFGADWSQLCRVRKAK